MKLSELRPCACCGGKIAPFFHILTVEESMGMLDEQATRGVFGLVDVLGGLRNPGAFAIAECMSPDTDRAVRVSGEEDSEEAREHRKRNTVRLFICNNCYCEKPLNLLELKERAKAYEAKVNGEPVSKV